MVKAADRGQNRHRALAAALNVRLCSPTLPEILLIVHHNFCQLSGLKTCRVFICDHQALSILPACFARSSLAVQPDNCSGILVQSTAT